MSRRQRRNDLRRGPFRIAVLISGSGTGLQNLIDRIRDGRLAGVEIPVVVSSRSDVEGVARAETADLPVDVIRVKDHPDIATFSNHLTLTLDVYDVDLVVQAGWLCYWMVPGRWLGKVINIHPSLLPKFGGKGFYGRAVHEAVLSAHESESGCTVHWVNNEYDAGEIIAQTRCAVSPDDTPETLASRVCKLEHELLPRVIADIRDGKVPRPRQRRDPT
ncbi:MAG: phosphoribosylglycinamide formyltransferase [Phycisphaerae bacterium]|nr:phosphoribosylglycinamide formyltransferase [Phycisphaerae bacterium]